jgi:hypothetical protein
VKTAVVVPFTGAVAASLKGLSGVSRRAEVIERLGRALGAFGAAFAVARAELA